jgi:carbon storage regulator
MLVLSRKLNQDIIINGNIRVTVLDIRGSQVRIGIDAPSEVTVFRKELIDDRPSEHDSSVRRHDDGLLALQTNRTPRKQIAQ